jgi:hypothetical protein
MAPQLNGAPGDPSSGRIFLSAPKRLRSGEQKDGPMKYSMRLTVSFGSKQKGLIECVTEFHRRNGAAPEISDGDNIGRNGAILHKVPVGGKSDVYDFVCKSEARSTLEKHIGRDTGVYNSIYKRDLFGFIGHVGGSRYWNVTKAC